MKVRLLPDKFKFSKHKKTVYFAFGQSGVSKFGLLILLFLNVGLVPNLFSHEVVDIPEEIQLAEALTKLSQKYEVFFSYDEKMVRDVEVTYEPDQYRNIEHALYELLDGTSLRFKIFDNRYIILYEESQEAITSLKGMVRHLESVIDSQEERTLSRKYDTPVPMLDRVSGMNIEPLAFNVSGTVTDQSGEPLIGVNIQVKGTTKGTSTDIDGHFVLDDIDENAVLVVSYIGYQTQEVVVAGKSTISIILTSDSQLLDEVVVVGYGTQKTKDLTGSISTVEGDRLAVRNTVNVSEALQGAVSGVMVTRNGKEPGASASIRIRGITTIGDSNPLILVDGVPANSIDDVNPLDIESISVLKDAATASIYGSRAASGVILVTTKRAKQGQLSLAFNYTGGFVKPSELPQFENSVGYAKVVNELRWNDLGNLDGGEHGVFPLSMIDNFFELNSENPDQYPNTNWVDLVLKNSAYRSKYDLSLTGGSDKVQSLVSVGYEENEGLYYRKKFNRINLRVNNNFKINNSLNGFLNMAMKRAIDENPSVADPMATVFRSGPVFPAIWTNGMIASGKDGNNVYGQLLKGGFRDSWNTLISGQMGIEFKPIRNLSIKGVIAPQFSYLKQKNFLKKAGYTNYNDPAVEIGFLEGFETNRLNEIRNDWHDVTGQLILNYDKTFAKHSFNVMAGGEEYYFFQERINSGSNNMDMNKFPYLNLSNANYLSSGGAASENSYRSYFGRITYNFADKYLIQANVRSDGSSRFAKEFRWSTFPSFSAGWIVSKESFMRNIPTISFLKIKASYGSLGNERIGNYPYQSIMNFSNTLFYRGTDVTSVITAAQYALSIQDISWETTKSYNIGMELRLIDYRLGISGEIYRKNTSGMLLALQIPQFLGFTNPRQNAGLMHTNGWEFVLDWSDNIGELKYRVAFNLSDFKSRIGSLSGVEFLGEKVKIQGSEFDEWFGYVSDGLFQTTDEVANSAKLLTGVKPGDVKYKDISGPDGKPDGIINQYDKVLLGGSLPRYIYGGNIRLNFKSFDFLIDFQGVGKQTNRITKNMAQPYQNTWGSVPSIIMDKYWSVYNSLEENTKATYPRLSLAMQDNNYAMSDYWLFESGYFRLKNFVLGYSLPEKYYPGLSIKDVRVFVSGQDLLTFDKYPDGWDPESSYSSYPITKTYSFGLSLKF